jgi:hypothetical protein
MRVTTNSRLIRRRGRIGMIASFAGIGVLALGMIASFRQTYQTYMWVSLVALVLGFVLAQVGSYNLRRWGRSPRPDQVLADGLKGFDDRYHLYAWTLPAPFVLLGPQGVYALTTRDQSGQVSVTGSTWRNKFSLARVLAVFAQEGLGNPTTEAQTHAAKLGEWIRSTLPNITVDVQPIIIFIDPRVQLEVNEPTVPVLDAKAMKKWLRGSGKGTYLKSAELRALEELFATQGA